MQHQETKSLNTESNIKADLVRVGLMHLLSGRLKAREESIKNMTLMAIAEINQSGGILGKIIEPIVVDIAVNDYNLADSVKDLSDRLGIKNLFGCGSSCNRKNILSFLEQYQAQLWYPYAYEGLESCENIFYTGSCPNQVVQPAISWLLQHTRQSKLQSRSELLSPSDRFYLIGTNGLYSRIVHKIIRAQLKLSSGRQLSEPLVYEDYLYSDVASYQNYQNIIAKIEHINPDAVISTLSPENSITFLQQYAAAGIKSQDIPVLSMRLTELELQQIDQAVEMEAIAGHFISSNYFQSLDTAENQEFLNKVKTWFGGEIPAVNAVMQSAYAQVFLWKLAVESAGTFEVRSVRQAICGQEFLAPAGKIFVEQNHHMSHTCRIAEITPEGTLAITCHGASIKPQPWLGLEDLEPSKSIILTEMLAEITRDVHQNKQIEINSQDLESTISQLLEHRISRGRNQLAPEITRTAMAKMFQANQRLLKAQSDLLNMEAALRDANEQLECRIEERTAQLQATILRLQNEVAERKRSEVRLQESQQQFLAIANNVPGVVYRAKLHANGEVSMPYLSPRTQEIFGISIKDFKEHMEWVFDMAHPEDRAALNEMVKNSAETLSPFDYEYRVSSLFENVKWVRIISQPYRQKNGDTVWDGVIINISAQKQIEESFNAEQEKSEKLLLNILPKAVVNQLKHGNKAIASKSDHVTILFADIVDFSSLSTRVSPGELVSMLNQIFSAFDLLADRFGLEKIKTIGDAYMVVGGLPTYRHDHAEAIAEMALAMQREISRFKRDDGSTFRLRIGINTGSVVAGVIGIRKFIYDLWGDAVNIASRMESHGLSGGIQLTAATYELLKDKYSFWHRGKLFIKGRGEMDTYMLLSNKSRSNGTEIVNINSNSL